jgi:hypothetical protein
MKRPPARHLAEYSARGPTSPHMIGADAKTGNIAILIPGNLAALIQCFVHRGAIATLLPCYRAFREAGTSQTHDAIG